MRQFYKKLYAFRQAMSGLTMLVIVISLYLFTGSCAHISALGGGPKDTDPPQLVNSLPLHASTGFKQQEIRLEFDKEITVEDIYNRLVVTPKLGLKDGVMYTYTIHGKTLKLKFLAPLQEKTTYTLNFKDAIKDTKEGIAADNLTLTFSTGEELDAMYVTGMVKHLMTDQPALNSLVALYQVADGLEADTLNILNSNPDYFTKTDAKGVFKLDHIKQGKYRICAGQSQENKLQIDPHKEPYGFLVELIDLQEPIENINLSIVEADVTMLSLTAKSPVGSWFELELSKPIVKYSLKLMQPMNRFKEKNIFSNLLKDGQKIRVYNTLGLLEEDSLEALLQAEDAMGNILEDTVSLHFRESKTRPEPFKYTLEPGYDSKLEPYYLEVRIAFNKPIKKLQPANIFCWFNEKDTIYIEDQDIAIHEHQDMVTIKKWLGPSTFPITQENEPDSKQANVFLHIGKEAFLSVEQEFNEITTCQYEFKNVQECGVIKGSIKNQPPGFIVQLLDEQNKVVQEVRNQTDYSFHNVLPGTYRIRVLALKAKEATWNFGNIHELNSPDPVVFYPHELPMVANWEFDGIDIAF
jgi:hypothetical protein